MTTDARNGPAFSFRLRALRDTLRGADIDALYITHPPNLRYLTGVDVSHGALLVSAATAAFIVDGRYVTAAQARVAREPELREIRVELAEQTVEESAAVLMLGRRDVLTVGVEARAITLSRFNRLAEALRASASAVPRLQPTDGLVEQGRIIKDAGEIALLRDAAARLSAVGRQAVGWVRPGRTERAIAARIDAALRDAGFARPAFETTVASGPNSALPHARPTDRPVAAGEGVVLDFGGIYDGYCVDLTRTVQLAPQTHEFGRLFDAVRSAHAAALRAVRPGVNASDVDRAAREELERHGLGHAFLHGTGHGLGLEVHEDPRVTRPGAHVDHVLRPGMVFTIEPGAYVPGLGGVRLEDDVLVVAAGCEVLTDVPIDRTCTRRTSGTSPTGG